MEQPEPRNRLNGILEDIGAEVGYTATSALVAWFGGSTLYVPGEAKESHALAQIIGMPAFTRLVDAWGGTSFDLPDGHWTEVERRNRVIAEKFAAGKGTREIAKETGLSERRIQQLKIRLESAGLLPLILKNNGKKYQEKPPEKPHAFGS